MRLALWPEHVLFWFQLDKLCNHVFLIFFRVTLFVVMCFVFGFVFCLFYQLVMKLCSNSQLWVLDLSIVPFNFAKFCFMYFEVMLLSAYKFSIVMSSYWINLIIIIRCLYFCVFFKHLIIEFLNYIQSYFFIGVLSIFTFNELTDIVDFKLNTSLFVLYMSHLLLIFASFFLFSTL